MISVLYGCDDNYAPYTGISMTSLLENNKEIDIITVYLASMDISEDNIHKFRKLAAKYNRNLIILDTFSAINKMKKHNCGTWNGSIATWLRFFVLDQIPESTKKILWIDSDTIVGPGLKKLSEIDIGNSEVAAVCDCISYRERFRLGLLFNEPYYNAGVILFNLDIWRKNNVLESLMKHLEGNIERYKINDQDLLNDYFRGSIYKLPPQYNVQCFLKAYDIEDYFSIYPWESSAYYPKDLLRDAIEYPVITHFFRFLGDYPWTRGENYHPAKGLYEEWKERSLWKDHEGAEPRKELSFKIEKILYRLLPRRIFLKLFSWYTNRGLPTKP